MKTLKDIPTPAFVVHRQTFARNCQTVLDLARARNLKLRPHIKTHKTLEGVRLQVHGTAASSSSTSTSTSSSGNSNINNNNVITGFVASTIPEVRLLVDYLTSGSNGGVSTNCSILFGVPISKAKLFEIMDLQKRLDDFIATRTSSKNEKESNEANGETDFRKRRKLDPCYKICILMDHKQQIEMVRDVLLLQSRGTTSTAPLLSVFVKLDTGYHRAGIACDAEGVALVEGIWKASSILNLVGLYSHCGHAYDHQNPEEIEEIAQTDMNRIQDFLQLLERRLTTAKGNSSSNSSTTSNNNDGRTAEQVFERLTISVGSTASLFHHRHPTDAATDWWTEFLARYPTIIIEIHPGNYTFYDRQQLYTKACNSENSIACSVLTRVIGHYDDEARPQTILLDAGATALTKETTPQGGMAALRGPFGRNVKVYKMSQEVSMARRNTSNIVTAATTTTTTKSSNLLNDFPLGSLLMLLPNHSCLAAACFDKYYVVDDDPSTSECHLCDLPIVEEWVPAKGW